LKFFVANGERVLHCPDDLQCIVLGVKLRRSEMVAHVKKVVWDQKIIELVKRELEVDRLVFPHDQAGL
jgi:hypothetical protein